MKRTIAMVMCLVLFLSFAACSAGNNPASETSSAISSKPAPVSSAAESPESTVSQVPSSSEAASPDSAPENEPTGAASLVVYFSVPETDKTDNMNAEEEYSTVVIDGEVLGNTQYVAYVIQEATGADIFRIEPTTPYPMDHAELEAVATQEKQEDALPEIAGTVENLEQYDTIYLGYPNWYADMPRIIYSFLDQYDFSEKTIVPFVTSGGSGFSNTIRTIAELEPDANVITDGFSVSRNTVADAKQDIIDWLAGLN